MSTVSGSRTAIDRTLSLLTAASASMVEHSSDSRRRARSRADEAAQALARRRAQEEDAWRRAEAAEQEAARAHAEARALAASVSYDREGRRYGPSPAQIGAAESRARDLDGHAAGLRADAREHTEARERCAAAQRRIDRAAEEIDAEFSRFWAWQTADIARARGKLTSLGSIIDAYLHSARNAASAAGFGAVGSGGFGAAGAGGGSGAGSAGAGGASSNGGSSASEGADPGADSSVDGTPRRLNVGLMSAEDLASGGCPAPADHTGEADHAGRAEKLTPSEAAIVELWTHGGEAMFRRAPEEETFMERDARDGRSDEHSFSAMYRGLIEDPITVRRGAEGCTVVRRGSLLAALIRAGAKEVPVAVEDEGCGSDTGARATTSAAEEDTHG
ncbi:hypothetical protein [Brevibacterium album]|uniref:hypothetical protein n=1 Tax=Brevibacterium album TaxID=417948 RepID=UPI000400F00C|nr:hypothetical protein [Brevibacterium album]